MEATNELGLECPHCGYVEKNLTGIFTDSQNAYEDYECRKCHETFQAERWSKVTCIYYSYT